MQDFFDMVYKFFKSVSQTLNSIFGTNFSQGGNSPFLGNNNGHNAAQQAAEQAAQQHNQFVQDELNRQFMQQSMEEAQKAVTPFDHGGYVQGAGFNPSDTMAADMQRQMDSMNNMNMGGMGGMGF